MFGLEKKKKALVEFDLQIELSQDAAKKAALITEVETMIQEIKTTLRQGTQTKDFDDYGVLLHGYSALLKVIQRIPLNKP